MLYKVEFILKAPCELDPDDIALQIASAVEDATLCEVHQEEIGELCNQDALNDA